MAIHSWELGLEYKNEVFNADNTKRQITDTDFEVYYRCEVMAPSFEEDRCDTIALRYFVSSMYQDNYPGSFKDNLLYGLLLNYQPFGNGIIDDLMDFLSDLVLGSYLPHPFKEINRDYYVSDRTIYPTNVRTVKSEVSTVYPSNGSSGILTNVTEYGYPTQIRH